jgi:hypothetical protein
MCNTVLSNNILREFHVEKQRAMRAAFEILSSHRCVSDETGSHEARPLTTLK